MSAAAPRDAAAPGTCGEALRSAQRYRRLRRSFACIGFFSGMVTGAALNPPAPLLVWNASASMPRGLYAIMSRTGIAPGDTVIARIPGSMRALAAARHYLPANVPLVKHVAAGPGMQICARGTKVTIAGKDVATRRRHDGAGRPMPWWNGCVTLGPRDYFLLAPGGGASFDGRYFGPSHASHIVGRARLLWRARDHG